MNFKEIILLERYTPFIQKEIARYRLNLSGKIILTEFASNNYSFVSYISSLAGAEKVYCFAKGTRYATKSYLEKLFKKVRNLLSNNNCILTDNFDCVGGADIVTNSGFLRPFTAKKISCMKSGSIIPLMWESWGLRQYEIDIDACKRHGVAVLGTSENTEGYSVMQHLSTSVLKLLLEHDVEILNRRYIIFSSDPFKKHLSKISSLFKKCLFFDITEKSDLEAFKRQKQQLMSSIDGIVLCELRSDLCIIGHSGLFNKEDLQALSKNKFFNVFCICGNYEYSLLKNSGVTFYPDYQIPLQYTSIALDYVSPEPMIQLVLLSLKITEIYLRQYRAFGDVALAVKHTLEKCPWAQSINLNS